MDREEFLKFLAELRRMPPDKARSLFYRAQMRGDAPRDASWIDLDPEWQKRFREAYRQQGADPHGKGWFGNAAPEDAARQAKQFQDTMGRPMKESTYGPLLGKYDAFPEGKAPPYADPVIDPPSHQGPERMPSEVRDLGLPDVQYPRPSTEPYAQDVDGLLARLRRMNPEALARNLGSRINAGPVGPWDLFPGGHEGYTNYLRRMGMDLPFTGGSGGGEVL